MAVLAKHVLFAVLCLALGTTAARAQDTPGATALATAQNPMTLVLDARDASRGLMHSRMHIPARAGTFTFVYPKWIPGEHGPTGPLNDISELRVSAGGHALTWRRDTVDMYAFHVDVPADVDAIDVDFTILVNAPGDTMSTQNVAVINWNRDLFYQADVNSHDYYVKPSIILPRGWDYGTALPGPRRSSDRIDFAVAPLNMLIDSPLDMGRYYKHIRLWSNGTTSQWMDVFADKPQDLDFSAKEVNAYKQMMPQALALYGSRHWNEYHSLLALSDAIGYQGIEHHQSSDDRAPDDFMTDPMMQLSGGDLVTHEFSHSWNGKYRRPADLTTLNFQIPMRTDLLWVYEGMNQYLGDMLSFRTRIRDPKTYPEYLATVYADMDMEPGRATEPLIDTTTAAPYLYQARGDYSSIRRTSGDFYTEGELIWLDADTLIRAGTGGKRSLDDFEHLFTEPAVTGPITKTYTRADVEALLNRVMPYDWHGFFQRYVYEISPHPPTDELARAGWRLIYTSKPNEYMQAEAGRRHSIDAWYSLGVNVGGSGTIGDVRKGSAAWRAGLAPGMKIAAIDGQQFDPDVLSYAIKNAQHNTRDITLLAVRNGWYGTYRISYHGGERYPHLVRIPGKPDMLAKIAAPH